MFTNNIFWGLPIKTWFIVGGLFILSSLFPTIIYFVLKSKEEFWDE